ncbi:hypothetical protein C8J57DRAFT_1243614 [Mycena rebaudengoi]|nr:hypothetical protein C8J57DRAFT_1243614 [Mycena rebaudengoi]
MATGVDKGTDMGICVPGNNGVNTVVAAWSTPTKTVSTRGYLGRPRVFPGMTGYKFIIIKVIWLPKRSQTHMSIPSSTRVIVPQCIQHLQVQYDLELTKRVKRKIRAHSVNPGRNYYRDHTRQQDGWTVLAPPPDLPPPYTQAAAPASAAAPAAVTGGALWSVSTGDTGANNFQLNAVEQLI